MHLTIHRTGGAGAPGDVRADGNAPQAIPCAPTGRLSWSVYRDRRERLSGTGSPLSPRRQRSSSRRELVGRAAMLRGRIITTTSLGANGALANCGRGGNPHTTARPTGRANLPWLPRVSSGRPDAGAGLQRAGIASLAGSAPLRSPSLGHSGSPRAPRLHHPPPGVFSSRPSPPDRGAGVSEGKPRRCFHSRRLADRVVQQRQQRGNLHATSVARPSP